jgi:hypothetical protein
MLLAELGIFRSALEEVTEGFIQVAQCLLRGHTRYVIQPAGFRLVF